jgi:hypothetical protein
MASLSSLSLLPLPPPTLTSISGCEGSGLSTLNCLPDRDVLTFQGSGLSIFRELYSFTINIGQSSGTVFYNGGVQVVNDNTMLITLNTSYSVYVDASHYTGVKLPISFNLAWYSVSSKLYQYPINSDLSISFVPLPPPTISSVVAPVWYSAQCQTTNSSTFIGCTPQSSYLQFYGHYLYSATITLSAQGRGSFTCDDNPFALSTSTTVACYLPLIPTDTDGQAWDVTITTSSGSLTYPGLVTFSSTPVLTSLVPCNMYGQQAGYTVIALNCAPGATLTIRGQRFTSDSALSVLLSSVNSPLTSPVNVSCLSPTVVDSDSTTLTCQIPVIDSSLSSNFYGMFSSVQAVFSTSGVTTNSIWSYVVAFPDSPVLTRVEGCEVSNGNLVVSRCRGGDVLTVSGMRLNGTGLEIRFSTPRGSPSTAFYQCTVLDGWTDSRLQCRLPYLTPTDSPIQADLLYPAIWTQTVPIPSMRFTPSIKYGNTITLAFTWDPRPGPSSSSSNLTAILAGVLVPVLVVMLVMVGVWRWRVMRGRKSESPRLREGKGQTGESSAIQLQGGSSESESGY